MSVMKSWNCFSSSSGPRLMLHSTGRISKATKSASAASPTMRSTFSAAIMTAGSFVLMALIIGTIFSCIVYLSRAVDEDDLLFFSSMSPLRPSSAAASSEPPQRITKACNPRTLIARLFVLLNTAATIGNSSLLIVVKSRAGRTTGKLRNPASTIECVGHSIAANTTGKISVFEVKIGPFHTLLPYSPSLNSLPEQCFAAVERFSRNTIKPASLAASFS